MVWQHSQRKLHLFDFVFLQQKNPTIGCCFSLLTRVCFSAAPNAFWKVCWELGHRKCSDGWRLNSLPWCLMSSFWCWPSIPSHTFTKWAGLKSSLCQPVQFTCWVGLLQTAAWKAKFFLGPQVIWLQSWFLVCGWNENLQKIVNVTRGQKIFQEALCQQGTQNWIWKQKNWKWNCLKQKRPISLFVSVRWKKCDSCFNWQETNN